MEGNCLNDALFEITKNNVQNYIIETKANGN